MKTFNFSTHKLVPYERNNRIHSDEQVARIAESIKEFGFNQPIVIDESNVILVGHARLEAAKKLQMETVPVVQIVGLAEEQKRAYRILDNKIQNDSTWDFGSLTQELEFLRASNFDMKFCALDEISELLGLTGPDDEVKQKKQKEKAESDIEDEKFLVVIEAASEKSQASIYQDCIQRGWKCKVI